MSSDIEFGITSMFRDAVRQSMVLELRTPADWDRHRAIEEESRARTREEIDSFERDRPLRLAAARKDIIDQAGAKTFEHPTPFGTDKFNKDEIERQAVAQVFNDHQSTLTGIKADEVEAYDDLRADIHAREGVRDQARDAFARSTDRRNGEERRMPRQSR